MLEADADELICCASWEPHSLTITLEISIRQSTRLVNELPVADQFKLKIK